MKSYLRRSPLFQPAIMLVGAIFFAVIAAALYFLPGNPGKLFVICAGLFVVFLIMWLFVVLAVQHRYSYGDDGITFCYLNIPYKKEPYHNIRAIVISNAAYNNGYGYGVNGNVPMQRHGAARAFEKKPLPFITLQTGDIQPNLLHTGMYSRELCFLAPDQTVCLGICWFDSLCALLSRTEGNIYLLEDVYVRFQSSFDDVFHNNCFDKNRIQMIQNRTSSKKLC